MARSRKKNPIVKDKGFMKKLYWKSIRRNWKSDLKQNWDKPDFYFKNPKIIINNYDYCDWWFIYHESPQKNNKFYDRFLLTKEDIMKIKRK